MIDWLMLHSLLIYEIDPVQYPLHIKHMWNPQNEFSIASWLQWLHNILYYYIYMRYDIVYSYTVYTIYIYISYINIQYMYTIYMYYMNHDMMYNILHNIQYNIHALKIICCVGHHCRATVPRWRVLPAVFGHGAWIEWDPDSNAVMFM